MNKSPFTCRPLICLCFVISGAASVGYQMIWLRQAMTYFGVVTPVISSVLSVFMLGLALGTFIAGRMTRRISAKKALAAYISVEWLAAVCALCVPVLFELGYQFLLSVAERESYRYLLYSWGIITLVLLPVCTLIGATLPLVMAFLESHARDEKNFGYLYFANLVGGVIGCLSPLLLIELYGFKQTLFITAAANIVVGLLALCVYRLVAGNATDRLSSLALEVVTVPLHYRVIIFLTGFVALGSEVIWIKLFTPLVHTSVYAFSAILAVYLIANFAGVWAYLKKSREHILHILLLIMPLAVLYPFIITAFTAETLPSLLSIVPLCFALGYITPGIIDRLCRNNAEATAHAYLYNLAGCVVGPLVSTYVLFPYVGLRGSLLFYGGITLLAPLFLLAEKRKLALASVMLLVAGTGISMQLSGPEETIRQKGELYRDHTGYIGATGTGMQKLLEINGVSMTHLTTITKNMAHLPMLYHPNAQSALAICFGMGTTVRSFTAWPLERITVVELSPGVVKTFPYFHADAARVLGDARVQVVIDDGRRFLSRATALYDIITIDPPPPVYSSGSGLLYSGEFYVLAKKRLSENGILAQWLPYGDDVLKQAVVVSIQKHFKYVRIYKGLGEEGLQFLASDRELPLLKPAEFVRGLPPAARQDFMEWHADKSAYTLAEESLREISPESLMLFKDKEIGMSDDRPYNEFFLLRIFSTGQP